MAYKQVVFADRLVGLSIQNGLVRMDLAVNAGTVKGKDDKPAQRMEITSQVVLPLDGFVNAVAAQQRVIQQLADQQQKRGAKAAEGDAAEKA